MAIRKWVKNKLIVSQMQTFPKRILLCTKMLLYSEAAVATANKKISPGTEQNLNFTTRNNNCIQVNKAALCRLL